MSRPFKFCEERKKIGIILPLKTIDRLDVLARSYSGDRSVTINELINSAKITAELVRPPPKPKTQIELLLEAEERKRGYLPRDLPPRKKEAFR